MAFFVTNGLISRLNPQYGHFLLSRFASLSLEQKAGVKKTVETVVDKLNIPAKPKKPLTPFFRYMLQTRASVVEKYPSISNIDISRKLGQNWETVEPKIKRELELQYQKEMEQYTQARLQYNNKLTDEQRDALKQEKQEAADLKLKRKLKKKAKELGKPKKPLSSYLLFAQSKQSERGSLPLPEFTQKLSKQWEALDEEEKKKYVNIGKENLLKYSKELAAWEEKMINLGHVDIVRTEGLIPKAKSKK